MTTATHAFLKRKLIGRYQVRIYGTAAQRYYLKTDVQCVLAELGIKNHEYNRVVDAEHKWVRDTDGRRRLVRLLTPVDINMLLSRATVIVPSEYAKRLGVDPTELTNHVREQSIGAKVRTVLRDERIVNDFRVQGREVHSYLPDYNLCIDFIEQGGKYDAEKICNVLRDLPNSDYYTFNGTEYGFNIYTGIANLLALMRSRQNHAIALEQA